MFKTIKRLVHFFGRRVILLIVNIIASPPDILWAQSIRVFFLKFLGVRMGAASQLSEGFYIFDGRRFSAGDECRLGAFCRIWDFSEIRIGNKFLASHGLTLISGTHYPDSQRTNKAGPITIGDNVWFGINVTVVGPVKIGDNVIVGANSLVNKNLSSNGIYGGSPARLIRRLEQSEQIGN